MKLPTFVEADHSYHLDGVVVPGVTGTLKPLTDLSMINPDVLEAASQFGRAVHRACELHDMGKLNESALDPALQPYLAGWIKFSEDYRVTWALIEQLVYHPTLRYAGTLDRYGVVGGEAAVVDIKSSTTLYPSVGPQLAAYQKALPPEHQAIGQRRFALQLKGDGSYVLKPYTNPMDFSVFCSLLTLRNWCQQHNVHPNFERQT